MIYVMIVVLFSGYLMFFRWKLLVLMLLEVGLFLSVAMMNTLFLSNGFVYVFMLMLMLFVVVESCLVLSLMICCSRCSSGSSFNYFYL